MQNNKRQTKYAAKTLALAAMTAFASFGAGAAFATTATFTTAPVTGCPVCTATDATGLVVTATGHQLPNGWDVKTGSSGLYIANGVGGTFRHTRPFDLTGMKLFATNNTTSTTAPVTYTLYAHHPGNPIADMVSLTINSRVVRDVAFSDVRLQNIDSLDVAFGSMVGYTYFIETRYTLH